MTASPSICHQGTVYPASAPAIPFLARAAVAAPGQRALIGLLTSGMSRQYREDWSGPSTFSGAVRARVAPVPCELAPLLADPDLEVRQAMLRIMAVCPPPFMRTTGGNSDHGAFGHNDNGRFPPG